MNNKLIGALVVVAALAVIGCFLPPSNPVTQQISQSLGATSEQLTDGACFLKEGLHICPFKVPFTSATTTTLCSVKTPTASSTIDQAAMNIISAGSFPTTVSFSISTSTTASGSTTLAIMANVPFAQGIYPWAPGSASTTDTILKAIDATGVNRVVAGPNIFLNFRTSTGTPATTAATGFCTGQFSY